MTVSTTTAKVSYSGDGTTVAFAVPFVFFAAAELEVIERVVSTGVETIKTLTTHYSVAGGNGSTGTVTAVAAPAATVQWTIRRKTARTQLTDYLSGDPFPADTHERALDRLTALVQEVEEATARALQFLVTDPASSIGALPSSISRASKTLAFDVDGKPTPGPTATDVANAAANATAATSAAASASANAAAAAASAAAAAASAAAIATPLTVSSGGTGKTSLAANRLLLGNGTGAVQEAGAGTAGQVMTSNGPGVDPTFQTPAGVPTGAIFDFGGYTAPSGYLLCDGAAVSRTTYAALWAALSASATVTITIASPGVVTWNSHPMQNGDPVRLQTTGALPTGLAVNTTYYVVSAGANTFQLSATRGGAAINTSGSQSGTHTAIYAPHGWGDNSTTFNVPDLRGRTTAGRDNMGGSAANRLTTAGAGIAGVNLGDAGGAQTVTLTTAEMPAHTHSGVAVAGNVGAGPCGLFTTGGTTGSTGGGGAHQNTQPTVITNKIIKT